ncbi:MAG: hypothetical protein Q4B91_07225 [Atopobiaceae bacterium]|nr:hypothetical protein [Atopobiaceae bacterium]
MSTNGLDEYWVPEHLKDYLRKLGFEKDKEGNWIDEIPDGNDHSIDAARYAMMDDVLRG